MLSRTLMLLAGAFVLTAAKPAPTFTGNDRTVSEVIGSAVVEIVKTDKSNSYSKVRAHTVDGTCRAGVNYSPIDTTLTFGNSVLKMAVVVLLNDNTTYNGSCTFAVQLDPVRFATILKSATITLTDNEAPPIVTPPPTNPPAAPLPTGLMPCDGPGHLCPIYGSFAYPPGWKEAPLVIGGYARILRPPIHGGQIVRVIEALDCAKTPAVCQTGDGVNPDTPFYTLPNWLVELVNVPGVRFYESPAEMEGTAPVQ